MVCPGPENRKLKGGGEYLSGCCMYVYLTELFNLLMPSCIYNRGSRFLQIKKRRIVIVACVNPKTNLFKAVFLFFEPFLPVQKHRRTKK